MKKGIALFVAFIPFHVEHGFVDVYWVVEMVQYFLSGVGLYAAQFENMLLVILYYEIAPRIAELANAIKQNHFICLINMRW